MDLVPVNASDLKACAGVCLSKNITSGAAEMGGRGNARQVRPVKTCACVLVNNLFKAFSGDKSDCRMMIPP